MIESLYLAVTQYFHTLFALVMKQWHQLTPTQYGGILVCIAIFGWLLMKSGMKKA